MEQDTTIFGGLDAKSEISFFLDNTGQLVTTLINVNKMTSSLNVSGTFSVHAGAHG